MTHREQTTFLINAYKEEDSINSINYGLRALSGGGSVHTEL